MTQRHESAWDRLANRSTTDAVLASWGTPPLWSAPLTIEEEEDQK